MADKDWQRDKQLFWGLMTSAMSDAVDAYEVLHKHPSPHNYRLSIGYLGMSQAAYMQAWTFYLQHEDIQHYEIDPVLGAYEAFKRQLKRVITDNDRPSPMLAEAYEELRIAYANANDFIESSN
ncbi:hypothetical protein PA598K_04178 [Paenibacillus sp. 598K]|uniref:hypothetical protein n=1 Tax=Paenibacillus sp. 598K TaxID=1117987 RepID=UPI000FF9A1F1|nr:hypothetical protein [Paenibacillus sp. 598K]GBF75748.1 hypothetical protein PA598K_04178 [Paenibacillus sp. 598K]